MRCRPLALCPVLLIMSACAGASSSGARPTENGAGVGGVGTGSDGGALAPLAAGEGACVPAALAPVLKDAVLNLQERSFEKIDTALLAHLGGTPGDFAADVLLDTVRDLVEAERRRADASIAAAPRRRVSGTAQPSGAAARPATSAPNLVRETDGPAGSLHPLRSAEHVPADEMRRFGPAPWHAPSTAERSPTRFIHDDHTITVLRQNELVVTAPRFAPLVMEGKFDGLVGARLVGSVLVVQRRESGAARNGVVAGIDTTSGQLLWSVDARTAVFLGSWVATEGAAGIDVRDVQSGTVARSIPVPEKPGAIMLHKQKVLALNGSRDVAFRVEGAAPPDPLALPPSELPPFFPTADGPCLVTHALDAIGKRDEARLARTNEALRVKGASGALVASFEAVREHLDAWVKHRPTDRIDLFAKPVTVLPAPPWKRTPPASPVARSTRRVTFTRKSSAPFKSDISLLKTIRPDQDDWLAPVQKGVPSKGARTDAPHFFGLAPLIRLKPRQDHLLLLYGERWLAIVREQQVETVFDLAAYGAPPFVPKKGQFVFPGRPTYVSEAVLRDNVLYLCDGGGSYAEMAGGMKSYVTAISYPAGEVLWRSQPLVCNAPLVPWKDYLITGYGFTAEPDFLYAIRTSDGSVAGKAPIATAAAELALDGDRLGVTTYDTRYAFTLSE